MTAGEATRALSSSWTGYREDVLTLILISVAVGIVLAVAYHILSMRLQTVVARHNAAIMPLVTILGFMVRMAVFVAILVVLGLWTPLNILALCLSFVVVFTILTGYFLYTMVSKRHSSPPAPGAGGAH